VDDLARDLDVARRFPGPVAVHCAADYRSTIAVSLLERAGKDAIIHIGDGFSGWVRAGGPVTTAE